MSAKQIKEQQAAAELDQLMNMLEKESDSDDEDNDDENVDDDDEEEAVGALELEDISEALSNSSAEIVNEILMGTLKHLLLRDLTAGAR